MWVSSWTKFICMRQKNLSFFLDKNFTWNLKYMGNKSKETGKHTWSIFRAAKYAASCSSLNWRSALNFSSSALALFLASSSLILCSSSLPDLAVLPNADPCSSIVLCRISTSSAGSIGPSIYSSQGEKLNTSIIARLIRTYHCQYWMHKVNK